MRSKCEVIFKESDFKLATIRSAKTQYEISTLSLIRIRDFKLKKILNNIINNLLNLINF